MSSKSSVQSSDQPHPLKAILTSRNAMLMVALVVIGLVFHWLTISRGAVNPFLSARSLSTVFSQASIVGVLACGMTFIIILTHIDLSVGSAVAFLGALAAWMMGPAITDVASSAPTGLGWNAGLTVVVVMLIGMVLWGLKGLLQTRTGMPAFIITLGGMMGYKGLAQLIASRERPIPTGCLIDTIGSGYLPMVLGWVVLGLVAAFAVWSVVSARKNQAPTWYLAWAPAGLMAAVILFLQLPHEGVLASSRGIAYLTGIWAVSALVMTYLLKNTVFGRHVYASGGNAEAAMLCGIRVKRVNVIGFVIMGVLTALAALMNLGKLGTAVSSAGELNELDAIAACVIGGVSLQGGRGSISGAVMGTLIMMFLTTGLDQCNVGPGYQPIIKAIVLVSVVALDHVFRKD
jgi:D-xylose transport system permease protein